MASDSSRSRIDQFFASRKRKSLSASLKTGRIQKDPRISAAGSPGAKGTLGNFLVDAPDDRRDAGYLSMGPDLSARPRQDPVRRNLTLDINQIKRDENKEPFSSPQKQLKPSLLSKTIQKETSQGSTNAGNVAVEAPQKGSSVLESGPENLQLKQFATEFLALYCSELQSTATSPSKPNLNDHNKCGSPLFLDHEDGMPKKRRFKASQLPSDSENACYMERKIEDFESACVVKNRPSVFNAHGEVTVSKDTMQTRASLRRCNKVLNSAINSIECSTPGTTNIRAQQTPKSTCCSSLFSPGEAFWNEAIQVADGLFAETGSHITQIAADFDNKNPGDNSREMVDGALSRVLQIGNDCSLDLMKKELKNSVKEVSPLPVKQLDFLFEDKNPDGRIPHFSNSNMHGGIEQSDCGSLNLKGSWEPNVVMHCSEDWPNKEMQEVQDIAVHASAKMKADSSIQNSDSIASDSSINKMRNLTNHGCGEAGTPSSFVQCKEQLDLTNWLPSAVCSIYEKRGISKLYPWQVDCLQVDGVLQRRNLVYCASTSAGKSFVAEILMLRRVMSSGKIALLVLPYVSICAEKAEHLEGLLDPLGKHVRCYYGNQGGATLPKDTSVAVCTIEKANSLINRLLEEGRLSEVGIIVIDELHMVGDQTRGYLLELMLTKLRYAAGEGHSESSSGESSGTCSKGDLAYGLQIVGMSATMPNVGAVADWLQAALYQTDFRPVPLEEYIKVGNSIYDKKMDIVRTIPRAADLGGKDPDHIVELCNEVVQDGHSVLIFCSSRKGCESTAKHVAKFLKKVSISVHSDAEFADIASAMDALRKSPAGLDTTLEETFPSGVAYHHAGLTVEEREIIETCYRRGLLHVLTATSTLAAGVNLPARRVIFRQPRIGRDFIDGIRYRQMAGRAGRTGIDTKGESVLVCKPEELKRVMGVLNESCPPLQSCLAEDKNGMTHAILEVVAGGIVQTADDIHRYVRCTLLNSTKPFRDVVKSAQDSLRWLCHKKFLEWNEDTKLYSTTPLGRAAFGSSLCPEESLIVLDDLSRAREGFVLASDLHLVYLVTPINVEVEPDWELYYERFMELSALDQSVGNRVGVSEPFLMRMAHGAPIRTMKRSTDNTKGSHGKFEGRDGTKGNSMIFDEQTLRVCKRFYVALILSRLVQEVPVAEVCEAFKVARGTVQALQENSGRFASMVSLFCERLGWHDLEGLVSKFQNRVSFGVRAEIVELTTIPYVKGSRARALYKAGVRTPLAIAEASIPEIVKALFDSSSWTAQEGTAQRRIQLGVARKIKNGARKIVLDKAEEARVIALSTFKSLGLNVPQFSRPLLSNGSGDPVEQGAGNPLSRNVPSNPRLCVEVTDNSMEVIDNSGKVTFGSGVKLMKTLNAGLLAPLEVKYAEECNAGGENPTLPAEKSLALRIECDGPSDHKSNADVVQYMILEQNGDETMICSRNIASGIKECTRELPSSDVKDHAHKSGPVNASNVSGGFDSFLDLWNSSHEFYFDIHYSKRSEFSSVTPFEIHGIAICWENSPVYYVNIPKDLLQSGGQNERHLPISASSQGKDFLLAETCLKIVKERWNRISEIMGKREVRKFTWNLKVQVQVLKSAVVSIQRFGFPIPSGKDLGLELIGSSHLLLTPINIKEGIDVCIMAWILWPDEEKSSNPNLEREAKRRLPSEAVAAANQSGRWKNQTRRAAYNGCCRRVALTRALCSVLWKLLISEGLFESFKSIEIPLVPVLADMELWGIGVDLEKCLQARNVLWKKLKCLEKEAYKLAGMTFSLYAPSDIANVLYRHLKLHVPEGHDEGKQHPSTNKHYLILLRHEHPIIPVIREHRTLAKLLNCTLGSICSLARLSTRTQKYTIHGHWLQTSTATGRLSMEEPNLQCVEHKVDFKMSTHENGNDADHYTVNARDFFLPTQDNWLLLAADYSQIELRLMAHFSKDASLIEFLSKPIGDVFTMIAAKWNGKPEISVGSDERDQTKRLVYGILYGMGANTLAEELDCSPEEAARKIKSFKSSFPGIASWLHDAVVSCRKKGYVETLNGRKRFLSKITLGNSKEKSKAQRQAVNSICQGSAADIIKIAMINIYSVIVGEGDNNISNSALSAKFHKLKQRCRILLQVHDELVLEVDPSVINEAASLLQVSMESAAVLLGRHTFVLSCPDVLTAYIYNNAAVHFSSFASQNESWKNMGYLGAFSCWSM